MGSRKAAEVSVPAPLVRIAEVLAEVVGDGDPAAWYAEAERLAEIMRGQVTRDWRGHPCLGWVDAERLLLRMRRDRTRRREEIEERAIAADEEFRSRLWGGLPADRLPVGASPAAAMLAADRELTPRRESVLEHALANGGQPVYRPIRDEEAGQ